MLQRFFRIALFAAIFLIIAVSSAQDIPTAVATVEASLTPSLTASATEMWTPISGVENPTITLTPTASETPTPPPVSTNPEGVTLALSATTVIQASATPTLSQATTTATSPNVPGNESSSIFAAEQTVEVGPTSTKTITPLPSSTPTVIIIPSSLPSPSPTGTATSTLTPGPSPTLTPSTTITLTPSKTFVLTQSATPTLTFTPSWTPSPTSTATVPAPIVSGGSCTYTVAAGDITGFVDAVNGANADQNTDTICLTDGTPYNFTTTLGLSNNYPYVLPIITSPIVIEGNNAIFTRSNPGNWFTVFLINVGGSLTLKNVTFSNWFVIDPNWYTRPHTIEPIVVNGQASLDNVSFIGGLRAIWVGTGATLTVNNGVFTSNLSALIWNAGTTTVTNSTFRANSMYTGTNESGAPIFNSTTGTMTLDNVNYVANQWFIYNGGSLTVTNSHFKDNLYNVLLNGLGTTTITGSVFTGNVHNPPNPNTVAGAAISVDGGTVNISSSCLTNNLSSNAKSAYLGQYGTALNAANNWWGSAQGPNQPGADTTNTSSYTPFLTAPILGCALPPLQVTDQSLSTALNTPVNITLGASGGALPYSFSTSAVAHGTLTGTAPNLTYTPNTGYTGPDSFTYTLTDGATQNATATIRIYVNQPIAANILVNSTAQEVPPVTNGNCTLGEAIRAANTNLAVDGCAAGTTGTDIIKLQTGTYNLTKVDNVSLNGANGFPVITSSTVIQGNSSTIYRLVGTYMRFFETTSSVSFALENIDLKWGTATNLPSGGGAVYAPGSLRVSNSIITGGWSGSVGGAIRSGTTLIENSTFSDNIAYVDGGAIYATDLTVINSQFSFNGVRYYNPNIAKGRGGAIFAGVLTLSGSTFTSNEGDAIYVGGPANVNSTITGSTFDNTKAFDANTSVINYSDPFRSLTISQSVIKNTLLGSAVAALDYNSSKSTVIVTNSCITGNASGLMDNITLNGNWWGAFDGPGGDYTGGGDPLRKYASYAPPTVTSWLTTPPSGCTILPPIANNQSVTTLYQQPVNITLTGRGGLPPYTYSVSVFPTNGTLSGTAPNLVYTPKAGFKGADVFGFVVHNSTLQISSMGVVTVYIVTDLQATGQNLVTAFNTPINFTLGATGGTPPYTFSNVTPIGTNGTLTGTIPNLTFTPNTNFIGFQRYTFRVTDAAGYTSTNTIQIEVAATLTTNDQFFYVAPQASTNVFLTSFGGLPTRSYTLTQAPAHGFITGTPPNIVYTADTGSNGLDTFKYLIADGSGTSVTSTITVFSGQMVAANSATVYTALNTPVDLPIGATGGVQPYTINVFDNSISPAPSFTYTPASGFTGTYNVDYSVKDSVGFISYGKITIKVGVQSLVLPTKLVTTAYQTPVTFTLSPIGGVMPYTYTIGTPAHGTITGTAPNSLIYTPNNGYSGTETVSMSVTDHVGTIQSANFTFTVYPAGAVNDVNGLIAAINAANANPGSDTITVTGGTFNLSDVHNTSANGPNGLPVITGDLTISGVATLKRDSAAPEFRFFEVASGVTLTLDGLTFDGGSAPNAGGNSGGAIYNAGTLALTNVFMKNNAAYQGGAVYNTGNLSVTNSTFMTNTASYGGAVNSMGILTITGSLFQSNSVFIGPNNVYRGGAGGAVLANSNSTSTITNTTFVSNTAAGGGTFAFGGGGAIYNYGTMSISASKFLSNTVISGGNGGAIRNGSNLTVTTSTFDNNTASSGGAILNGREVGTFNLTISGSTFSNNRSASDGGALYVSTDTFSVTNSTFSGNVAGRDGSAIGPGHLSASSWIIRFNTFTLNGASTLAVGDMQAFGNILLNNTGNNCASLAGQASQGYNISDDVSCGFGSLSDVQNALMILGPLASNGGPTNTHMPYTSSLSIDSIPAASCNVATDQRGVSRPVGTACDAGSVERESSITPPIVSNVNSVADTGDGTIKWNELVEVSVTKLLVTFDRSVQDPAGSAQTVDVTNPASYRLVSSGADKTVQTVTCSTLSGDDSFVAVNSVTYDDATHTATVSVNGATALPRTGPYRLLVCSSGIRSLDGRPIDGNGDGISGDDYILAFSTDTSQFSADVSVAVADSPDPVVLGQTLTYTITVSNAGPQTAQDVILTDTLPANVALTNASGTTCTTSGQTLTCNLGTIAASANKVVTLTTTVNGTTFRSLTNTASTTGSIADPNAANNTNIQTMTNANEAAQSGFAVNTTSMVDDGVCGITHCSLPEAINAAAAHTGADTITFNLPGAGPYVLQPLVALPTLSDGTTLDGRSQSGYTNKPIITLSGASTTASGLQITGNNNAVQGLIFINWKIYSLSINAGNNNKVIGNYIGTDGTTDKGDVYGIQIINGSNNTIGGTTPTDRNIISGNTYGIYLSGSSSTGNVIQGNYIGTDVTGKLAIPNVNGIYLVMDGTTIGGTTGVTTGGACTGACNLISANQSGIYIDMFYGRNTTIQGNFIGTDVSGKLALGNTISGIFANTHSELNGLLIGGASPAARNLISANGVNGVYTGGANSTNLPRQITVQNNYVGVDTTGAVALGNGQYGLRLLTENNTISGNLISDNKLYGIELTFGANNIYGNLIGTNAAGTAKLGTQQVGMDLSLVNGTVVGGAAADQANVIVGTSSAALKASGQLITIQGNRIGTDITGTLPLGNSGDGIYLTAYNVIIGGTNAGEGNIVAYNQGNGILVSYVNDYQLIQGNSIFANGGLGIDLDNAAGSPSISPAVTSAVSDASTTTLAGSLNTQANKTYQIELFANDSCAANDREGQTFLTRTNVTTDGSGNATFSLSAPARVAPGKWITATSTTPTNNTSEFSACTRVFSTGLPPSHYQETEDAFIYSGSWYSYIGNGPEGGSFKYSNDASAKVSFPIANNVERVTIFHAQNTIYGAMDMYLISGGVTTKLATIPGYGPLTWAVPFNISVPSGTNRLIELRNTSSSYIGLEAVDLLGALPYLPQGTYQENNSNFIYSGNWVGFTGAGPQGGAFKYSNDANAKMIFGVDSTVGRITFYRTTYNIYGSTQIYLDGALTPFATMNNSSSGLLFGVPFTITIPSGNHTIELGNVGTNYTSVDRIDLLPAAAALPVGTYQETDANLTYSGIWTPNVNASALGGSRIYTNDPSGSVTFNIDNTVGKVTIYRTTYLAGVYGSMQVYLDGAATPIATLNNTSATFVYGVPFTFGVIPGNHTITLKNVGATYSDLDQIVLGAAAPLSTGTYQEDNAALIYNGAWTSNASASALAGTRKYTNDPNGSVSFLIDSSVSRITVYHTTYLAGVYGSMQVFVDNSATPLLTISNTSAAFMFGQPITFSVTPGNHIITLKNVGSTYSDLDQITLLPAASRLGTGTYQETDTNLTYSGIWTPNVNASALGGSRIYTNDPSGSVTFNIDNTVSKVTIYRTTYLAGVYGSMQVYLDGAATPIATLNNTSAAFVYGVPFTFGVIPGNHTITLKNVGATYSDLDQIVLGAAAPLSTGTYQEDNAALIYNGAWTSNASASALAGTRKYTNDPNGSVSFLIDSSVSRITVYHTTYLAGVYGSMQVFVDNSATPLLTISNTSAAFMFGQPITFSVTPGNHIITLKNVGSTYSDLDQITLLPAASRLGTGTYQETDTNLTYSGIWTPNVNASALGSSRIYTNDPNGSVSFLIDSSVTRITIYRTTYLAGVYGSMQVYLDGAATPITTINNTSSGFVYGVSFSFTVAPGNHIVTIKNVGATYSDLDQITLQTATSTLGIGTYQETDAALIYEGAWTPNINPSALGGSRIYTNDPNASVHFQIDNTVGKVTIYRTTYLPGVYGQMVVYLDNAPSAFAVFNNTSAAFVYGVPFTFEVPPGNHTIRLMSVGLTYADLDQIVLGPSTSLSVGTYQETDPALIYNGTWTSNANASALGGTRKYTNDPYGSVTFAIDNSVSQVTVYHTTYTAGVYGAIQIFLDNSFTPLATLNNTSSTFVFGVPFAFNVTPGNHIITLKNVGSTYSDLDQIVLSGVGTQSQPLGPTATLTPTSVTATPTTSPTPTTDLLTSPTPTVTDSPTQAITATLTVMPTNTAEPTVVPTVVPTDPPALTNTPIPTSTAVPTEVPTSTPISTDTPLPTDVPTLETGSS